MFSLKKPNNVFFFTFLFVLILIFFKGSFKIHFFQDDYFFLKISRATNLSEFVQFYSPIREYSYKPLATETFYFFLHLINENIFIGHLFVVITYFIGLIFLYKIVLYISRQRLLAFLSVFFYGLSFIHVFQLYWFATFQEVAVFSFLCISFYCLLKDKHLISSLFFVFALFCKETAILYTPFLVLYIFLFMKNRMKKAIFYIIISIIFYLLYKYSLRFVTSLDNYKMIWNPKLLINNSLWYFLWGMGLPNFLPDYFRSIFTKPLTTFWEILKIPYAKFYLLLLLIYLLGLLMSLIVFLFKKTQDIKRKIGLFLYCLINFYVFLGPILFFRHKWMIRLTMPLIFISIMESVLIFELLKSKKSWQKYLAIILIITYFGWNFLGVKVHEVSSTYLLENSIYLKTKAFFGKNKKEILKYNTIYLKDTSNNLPKGWNGSEKLVNSFAQDNFINHFIPEKKYKVFFGYQNGVIPKNTYVINSQELMP